MAEQRTYDCRVSALAEVLAAIDRTPMPDDPLVCDEPAAFATVVVRKRDGQDVDLCTRLCEHCDRGMWPDPGYKGSTRLRAHRPSSTP